jgi:hypothetical protein
MVFPANVLRVMIASPGDVAEERKIVTEAIHRWNDTNAVARNLVLLPVKWETHSTPQHGDHPQTIINRQLLDEAEILVAIFGTRIGTPTEGYVSGTVEEIKKHVAAGKVAKVYFSDVPISPSSLDAKQYALLQDFKKECQSDGLHSEYKDLQQFRADFTRHLDIELNQPRYRWLAPPALDSEEGEKELRPDALRLIKAAGSSDDGMILHQETLGGYGLSAGSEEFMKEATPRSAAKWRAVLDDLAGRGIIELLNPGVYRLTSKGYELADEMEAKEPTEIELAIAGSPEAQYLAIKSNRVLRLSQLGFLTSSEASIAIQKLSEEGQEIKVNLVHDRIVTLFNTPRPDQNSYDHGGPAKLRLRFLLNDQKQEIVLPVMLLPKVVGSTQWVALTGSQTFQIPVT